MREYDAGLRQRGSLTRLLQSRFLFLFQAVANHECKRGKTPGKHGTPPDRTGLGQRKMADFCGQHYSIERMLHLRARGFAPATHECNRGITPGVPSRSVLKMPG